MAIDPLTGLRVCPRCQQPWTIVEVECSRLGRGPEDKSIVATCMQCRLWVGVDLPSSTASVG